MPKIQLVTDVSQWGLLSWPAATRNRLVASTVVMTALTILTALGSATYIMEMSTSVLLNLVLITTNMFLLLVAAFLQATTVGEFFFAGPWRERVFLGQRPKTTETLDLTTVNDHNAEFIVLIIVAILLNAFGLNLATGGFFGQYHDEGFFHVQMRSSDPGQRAAALASIADPNNNRLWERDGLRQLIVDSFEDPATSVRQQAIFTAGSLSILRARPVLRELVANPPDELTGAEAAFTLGKLGRDRQSREVLEGLLHTDERELRLGALRGLARMRDPLSVEALITLLDEEDEIVEAYAFWALARVGSSIPAEQVQEIIETTPHGFRRCAALEAYKLVAPRDAATYARRQFGREARDNDCEGLTFEELDDRINYVVYGESARVKWLKTVGNTDPYEHRNWITRLLADPEEEVHVRDVAAEILRQMDR